ENRILSRKMAVEPVSRGQLRPIAEQVDRHPAEIGLWSIQTLQSIGTQACNAAEDLLHEIARLLAARCPTSERSEQTGRLLTVKHVERLRSADPVLRRQIARRLVGGAERAKSVVHRHPDLGRAR